MQLSPHPFSLRQLQYLVAVAETRSFRRAAERCSVSQPSLSAQIAEIENALGTRVFERDRRSVILTAAGAEIIERARRVLLDAEDVAETALRFVDPLQGTLRVGVIPTIGPYLLPQVVPDLTRRFPRLSLLWAEDKTEVLVARVGSGDLDAAILAQEADLGALDHELVLHDRFVLATPAKHRLAVGRSAVKLSALEGEKILLLDDGHCLRDQALGFCARIRLEELAFRATSLPTLVQMVSSGAGITLLPELSVKAEQSRSRIGIRQLDAPCPARTIVLAWRKSSPLIPALRKIGECLRARLA